MGSYTVEQVEFLRQRADISYEEALEVLERCNGDLTRCLVDLERRGLIRKTRAEGRTYHAQGRTRGAQSSSRRTSAYQQGSSLGGLIKKLSRMRLVVTNGRRTYVDLSIIYLIIATLFAPHLMIFTVIAMFVLGLKIRMENGEGDNVGNEQFYDTVDKVADNIKSTVTSFTRAARETNEKVQRENVEKHTPYAAQDPADTPEERPQRVQTEPPRTEPESVPDVDIPDVTPYEAFTGEERADSKDEDENEFTIG